MKKLFLVIALNTLFVGLTFGQSKPVATPDAEKIKACKDQNLGTLSEASRVHQSAKTGLLSADEEKKYSELYKTAKKNFVALSDNSNVTLADCQKNNKEIQVLFIYLQDSLAVNGKVRACFDELKEVIAETEEIIAKGRKNHKFDDFEARDYKARAYTFEKRYGYAMENAVLTQAECDKLLAERKKEKAWVIQKAAR
jgi:hypothetical protein